ncbi:MAG TPA: DUF6491 family protein [Steroidobacteraceae bacterium]|nr:DUF6491 family protein [Steroidobacteraceae bacterium]
MTPRVPWIGLTAMALAACSSLAPHETRPSLERYLQYAGPPIQRFSYRDSDYGWQTAAADKLVMFVARDAYLLGVSPPCSQLQFAQHIRLNTAISGSVSRYDYVLFDDQKCLIDEIRPVDYRRMQQDAAHNSG